MAFVAVLIGSAYAYMGNPRIEGPDMVVSADTVTNRVGDEVTLTGQWKYEFLPPDTEITNQFQPIAPASCSNWFVSPSPAGTGFKASSGGTNYYTNLVHLVNPVYFKASVGGEYDITLTAWSDLFQKTQDNTLHITSLHVDIEQAETNTCWQMANAGLNLTNGCYWAPPGSGGDVTWSSSPAGLSGSGSAGTFTFNPSASTPTSYIVTAQSTLLPICTDTCMVRVLKMDIEQTDSEGRRRSAAVRRQATCGANA